MIRNLSLAARIGLGFGLVAALLLATGLISAISQLRSVDAFEEYRLLVRDAELAERLEISALRLDARVTSFLGAHGQRQDRTYVEESITSFDEGLANLTELVAQAQQDITKQERRPLVEGIAGDVDTYGDAFDSLIGLVQRRDEIVRGTLDVAGPAAEEALTEILVSAQEDDDLIASYYAGLSLRNLLPARLYMEK